MASGLAGINCILKIGTDILYEARNVTFNNTRESIEDTARDTTTGYKSFIGGLGEWSVEGEIVKKYPVSTAAEAVKTAFLANSNLSNVQVLDSQGNGFKGDVAVTNYTENQPNADVVTISFTFSGRGTPTEVVSFT